MPHFRHSYATVLFAAFHLPKERELDIKQFFKLQSFTRSLYIFGRFREVDFKQSIGKREKVVSLHYIHTERIGYALLKRVVERGDDGIKCLTVKPNRLHLVGSVIDWHQSLDGERIEFGKRRKFWMGEIISVIKYRRLAEEQIGNVCFELEVLDIPEPH